MNKIKQPQRLILVVPLLTELTGCIYAEGEWMCPGCISRYAQ
jgi:hypothetical protein